MISITTIIYLLFHPLGSRAEERGKKSFIIMNPKWIGCRYVHKIFDPSSCFIYQFSMVSVNGKVATTKLNTYENLTSELKIVRPTLLPYCRHIVAKMRWLNPELYMSSATTTKHCRRRRRRPHALRAEAMLQHPSTVVDLSFTITFSFFRPAHTALFTRANAQTRTHAPRMETAQTPQPLLQRT